VLVDGRNVPTDQALAQYLGGPTPHLLLAAGRILTHAADKRRFWLELGCAAVDIESAAVAEIALHRVLPFAVLRAVCDPADYNVPSAALAALSRRGRVNLPRVLASVARNPSQTPALFVLAKDALAARRALVQRVAAVQAAALRRPAT
ncbi:MAG: hypothetical protein M3Y41_05965, partial [Pseudomonadota bacterium]|nr:hypothetical protein [Pseudomonadota bacterium]